MKIIPMIAAAHQLLTKLNEDKKNYQTSEESVFKLPAFDYTRVLFNNVIKTIQELPNSKEGRELSQEETEKTLTILNLVYDRVNALQQALCQLQEDQSYKFIATRSLQVVYEYLLIASKALQEVYAMSAKERGVLAKQYQELVEANQKLASKYGVIAETNQKLADEYQSKIKPIKAGDLLLIKYEENISRFEKTVKQNNGLLIGLTELEKQKMQVALAKAEAEKARQAAIEAQEETARLAALKQAGIAAEVKGEAFQFKAKPKASGRRRSSMPGKIPDANDKSPAEQTLIAISDGAALNASPQPSKLSPPLSVAKSDESAAQLNRSVTPTPAPSPTMATVTASAVPPPLPPMHRASLSGPLPPPVPTEYVRQRAATTLVSPASSRSVPPPLPAMPVIIPSFATANLSPPLSGVATPPAIPPMPAMAAVLAAVSQGKTAPPPVPPMPAIIVASSPLSPPSVASSLTPPSANGSTASVLGGLPKPPPGRSASISAPVLATAIGSGASVAQRRESLLATGGFNLLTPPSPAAINLNKSTSPDDAEQGKSVSPPALTQ